MPSEENNKEKVFLRNSSCRLGESKKEEKHILILFSAAINQLQTLLILLRFRNLLDLCSPVFQKTNIKLKK
jgi:hypothetical protein